MNVMDMERHDDFVNEMKLLHRAKHSNILMFVGFCNAIFIEDMNETRPGMVTELCPGKTLYYGAFIFFQQRLNLSKNCQTQPSGTQF